MESAEFEEYISHIRQQCIDYLGEEYMGEGDMSKHWFHVLSISPYALEMPHRYPISVRPATHGNGLFADCDIPKGTVITMYPAHHIARRLHGDTHEVLQTPGLLAPNYAYRITISDTKSIIGCPSQTQHPWFLAHLSNDVVDLTQWRKGKVAQFMYDYHRRVEQGCNVKFCTGDDPDVLYLTGTRNIKKGEELLVSYGIDYWFKRLGVENWRIRLNKYKGQCK
jgi:hypothetical protein